MDRKTHVRVLVDRRIISTCEGASLPRPDTRRLSIGTVNRNQGRTPNGKTFLLLTEWFLSACELAKLRDL
jgi:hypothetical protein